MCRHPKNEDDLTQQRYMTLHLTQKMKTTSLYNEWLVQDWNGMKGIPFWPEWIDHSIPAGMEWIIPFWPEWSGRHSIPARME